MLTNKVKSILALNNQTLTDYARILGKTKQSLNKKTQNETYTISDIIKLCDALGYSLCIINKDGKEILSFDIDDIPPSKK